MAIVLLAGCGDARSDGAGAQPEGLFIDQTTAIHLKTEFEQVKTCTGIDQGAYEDLSIVMMPPVFPCDHYPTECSGEFKKPNTVLLGNLFLWRHEVIHYLLYAAKKDADPGHTSAFWEDCIG